MTSRYSVSTSDVRKISGISASLVDDASLTAIIDDAEYRAESDVNCKCIPTTLIELIEGQGNNRIRLRNNPLLKVRAVNINDTDVTTDYLRIDKSSGVFWLVSGAEQFNTTVNAIQRNLVRVKYDYGLLHATSSQTDSTADVSAGSSVSIAVTDSSAFSANDYVEIVGMDAKIETFKVSSVPDGTHVVADNLAQNHESGSLLTLQQIPGNFIRLVKVIASLMGVAEVVGSSFDEITGYQLGDMRVQKGEPYTQWRETALQLTREYETLLEKFRPRPVVR